MGFPCPDLKSLGIDPCNAKTVFKFDEYNEPLYDALSELGDDEKVILVAYSIGGLSVMAAMYKYMEKMQAPVFVAATMVRDTSSGQDSTLAGMLLRPKPVRALMDAKFGDDDVNIDDVPRVYIKTMHDNLMPSDRQDDMIEQWPLYDLYTIDSDHSAFFSNPHELFGLLLMVAANYIWSP